MTDLLQPRVFPFAYSRDDVTYPEDGSSYHFRNNHILDAYVFDGCDAFHSPKRPRQLINGLSRAQFIGRMLRHGFSEAPDGMGLREVLVGVNDKIANWALSNCLSLIYPDHLPGLDVAAARITPTSIEFIEMGDALLFWERKSGETGGTPNKAQTFEQTVGPQLRAYKEEFGDTGEAWNQIEPLFREARRRFVNNLQEPETEVMLNGQSAAAQLWVHEFLPRDEITLLLLMTDGLFDEEESFQDPQALAAKMCRLYREDGWEAIFDAKGCPDRGEGTGIAVVFD